MGRTCLSTVLMISCATIGGLRAQQRPGTIDDELARLVTARPATEPLAPPDALDAQFEEVREALATPNRGLSILLFGGSASQTIAVSASWTQRLKLPLYRIDLSSVVERYGDESQRRLSELFAKAEGLDVVLLFDEADSLLGRRTEVADARDRYANLDVDFLLERVERSGVRAVIVATRRNDPEPTAVRRFRFALKLVPPSVRR